MKPVESFTSAFRTPSPPPGEDAVPASAGANAGDPYELLDDLMCVIEELCPRWPSRPIQVDGSKWLL